jgi:hypothetical protein
MIPSQPVRRWFARGDQGVATPAQAEDHRAEGSRVCPPPAPDPTRTGRPSGNSTERELFGAEDG